MNLHGLAAGAIGRVNPHKIGTLYVNGGYITQTTGERTAAFSEVPDTVMQVQPLSTDELALVEGMGYQGIKRAVYLYGQAAGVVRRDGTGGDLLFFDGAYWLVVQVLEAWNGWCKVAVVQQLDRAAP